MKAAAAIALSVILAGCATPPAAPPAAPVPVAGGGGTIVALDARAAGWLACSGLEEWRLADGRLGVLANLTDKGPGPLGVEVQCVFDGAGRSFAAGGGSWQRVPLGPGGTETVRFTSVDAAAQSYLIRVRSAR